MRYLKDILIATGLLLATIIAIPLAVALGAWMAEFMLRWGLLP